MQQHSQYPPKQSETGYHSNNDEPEPKEHVDLLINDIQCHYAEGVVGLYRSRGTVFMKNTLGHLERVKFPSYNVEKKFEFREILIREDFITSFAWTRVISLPWETRCREDPFSRNLGRTRRNRD